MSCPDINSVDLVLQGARQSVATFELRSAVDIYFRRRTHMSVSGSVYVYAIVGSVRALVGQALLPVGGGGFPPGDFNGSLVLSLRNIMAEKVEIETDGTSYVSDDGFTGDVDPYATFSIVAWGEEPSAASLTLADKVAWAQDTFTSQPLPNQQTNGNLLVMDLLGWDASKGGHKVVLQPGLNSDNSTTIRKTAFDWCASGLAVLGGTGRLYQVLVTSKATSPAYLFVYDSLTPPADPGVGLPLLTVPLPAGAMVAVDLTMWGLVLNAGLSFVVSSSLTTQATWGTNDFRLLLQHT